MSWEVAIAAGIGVIAGALMGGAIATGYFLLGLGRAFGR